MSISFSAHREQSELYDFIAKHFDIDKLATSQILYIIQYIREFKNKLGRFPAKWEMEKGIYEYCSATHCPISSRRKTPPYLSDIVKRKDKISYITEE